MTPGRLPAIILMVVFLACHGLFGAAHETTSEVPGKHMPLAVHGGDHGVPDTGDQGSGQGAGHAAGDAEYAAVLITVLLLATLGLMRLFHARIDALSLRTFVHYFRASSIGLHPPRGPTLPALQVFRL